MKKLHKQGFTLLEVIIVSGLIALGASLVYANTDVARAKGRDTRRVSDLQQIQKAISLYQLNTGNFPTALESDLVPTYISELNPDPQTNQPYFYHVGCGTYHLGAVLERSDDRRLTTDVDGPACNISDFDGLTADCVADTPGSTDLCFDIKP